MKAFATGLALLIALTSPEAAFAKAKKGPVHPRVSEAPVYITGSYWGFARRPHSPNPAWDVYRINGHYVGSDPDPNVRLMLRKDRVNQY